VIDHVPDDMAESESIEDADAQPAALRPDVTSFEATVESVDGRRVTLDRSFFYAESGGQPADRGTIGDARVEHVVHEDGSHVHHLAAAPEFDPGEAVACAVDETFRRYCTRAHTASHVLYGAGRRLFDEVGYGGFDIDAQNVRVDLAVDAVDDAALVELERLANRAVWESREVSWRQLTTAEAYEREEIAYNAKTEEGVLTDADTVRVVTVEGWDWAACGGTHVSNTAVIGPIAVLERSNPGEGMTRVEFAVGPVGVDHRSAEKRAVIEAARTAGVAPVDLPDEVDRLQEERDRLRSEVDDLRERALAATVADLDPVERDGYTLAAGVVEGAGANDVEGTLRAAAGDRADAVALVGQSGSTFVAVGADGETADAGAVVSEVTEEFGGGGGGSSQFAQGGGIQAGPGEVVSFLRGA